MNQKEHHQNALLRSHRCSWCAERISEFLILRQANCPKCDNRLEWHTTINGQNLQSMLKERWKNLRWVYLAGLAFVSIIGGQVPMLQSVLFVVGLFVGHWLLIRRPLRWLPPARRVCAKVSIQLAGVLVSLVMLILNALVVPFLIVDGFVLAFFSVLNMVIYIHFAFYIIKKRLKWEISGQAFGIKDWLLPGSIVITLVVCASGVGLGLYWIVDWLSQIQFPGASDLADWLDRLEGS